MLDEIINYVQSLQRQVEVINVFFFLHLLKISINFFLLYAAVSIHETVHGES